MSLRSQKILFFIVGIAPTTIEQDLIDRLRDQAADVGIRSLTNDTTYGGLAEACDGIAIADNANIPAAYSDDEDFPVVTPAALGTSVVIENGDGPFSVFSAIGTKQKDTATAAGTITVAGNALVTVTSAALGGDSPLALNVPVLVGDTAALWAAKVREALSLNAIVKAKFNVSGSTTAIALERKIAAANDGTLNIALATGTATGVTPAASSANTTAGVAPTEADTGTAIVAEGALQGLNSV